MALGFLGTYTPRLDDKGRLILPAKFRADMANGIVLTRGMDRCIAVYTVAAFEQLSEKLRQSPASNRAARNYIRVLLSGASDMTPDSQGRIPIPPTLREYAGLERDVAVVGQGDHVEIWDSSAWDEFLVQTEQEFANISDEIIPGLF
ncbi:division/cell wall cluster transcriptional repressor MraZ [Micrococcales bacterium 31B]|nr:division/cell wall cluster transcriptional repressor MraZ [Micrococcales bacterium 31B]